MSFGNMVGWWLLQGLVAGGIFMGISLTKSSKREIEIVACAWCGWMKVTAIFAAGLWLVMQ